MEFKDQKIACRFPKGWEAGDDPDIPADILVFAPGIGEPFSAQVQIYSENLEDDMEVEDYVVANSLPLMGMDGFEELSIKVDEESKPKRAFREYRTVDEDFQVRQLDIYLVVDDVGYLINCKAPEGSFRQYRSDFESIGHSVRLVEY